MHLITLDPGHFHAALLQRESLPGVDDRVHIYAPLDPDLLAHLQRIARFNSRPEHPTHWQLEVHAGPNFLQRMLRERPGNVVVLSGRNQPKMDYMQASVRAGLHVLADKPWIIEAQDLPKVESALEIAERRRLVVFDAMTQRFEVTCLLQRALVNSPEVFGAAQPGTLEAPAVHLESVHYLVKEVAGTPSLRPAWFFDIRQQGEGLADVGTHLADLVAWTLFPDQAIDYHHDLEVLRADRWPTLVTLAQFQRVTGEREFPDSLRGDIKDNGLAYMANNSINYTLRGLQVRLDVKWEVEAPPGGQDTELAIYQGSLSRVEVRQGRSENFVPEVYVVPNHAEEQGRVREALERRVTTLQDTYPGLAVKEEPGRLHVVIPSQFRVGHEAHFSLLVAQFLKYVRHPKSLPAWEKPNLLAKYFVTTRGVQLARSKNTKPPENPKSP